MNAFDVAYGRTRPIEGGYSNDPDDPGGETYGGIARNRHPNWPGWQLIDALKKLSDFPRNIDDRPAIQEAVKEFYLVNFWRPLLCDQLVDVEIACEVFDTSVNMGPHWGVLFLQKSLNLLNRNASLYPDLVEDGVIGEKTLSALQEYFKRDAPGMLLLWQNVFQGARYAEIMKKSPTQEKYARGWAKRVRIVHV